LTKIELLKRKKKRFKFIIGLRLNPSKKLREAKEDPSFDGCNPLYKFKILKVKMF